MNFWQGTINLRSKILVALLLVGVGSTLLSSWEHYNFLKKVLVDKSIDHVTSIRDSRKREIEGYFNRMHTATQMLAKGWTIVNAANDFNKAFAALEKDLAKQARLSTSPPESLRSRYEEVVDPAMAAPNKMAQSELNPLLPHDPKVIYLQDRYAPEGVPQRQKERNQTAYEQIHARYHAFFKGYRQDLNVHDIFLIDSASGAIVYSTRKAVDFGTNVLTGPWQDGQLATVFKNVVESADGKVKVTDFGHYCPADHLPAAFMAAPVRDGDRTIAVLALQLSVAEINEVMTDNKNWRARGLGETGETYIVGSDYTMRNDSRFLLEARDGFFAEIKARNVPAATLAEMEQENTTILLMKVATESTRQAFKGQTGTALITDYRGLPVLSAFTPLEIGGMDWVLLAEMDQKEIFASIDKLQERLFFLLVVTLVLIAVTGALLSSSLAKPITTLIAGVRRIGQGPKVGGIEVTSRDEIGELATAFNELVANLSLKTVSLNYFSSIINSMNEMLFVLEIDDQQQTTVISEVNQAVLAKLGFSKEYFEGKAVEDFFADYDEMQLFAGEKLAALLGSGRLQGSEKIFLSKTGEQLPVIISASVMRRPEDSAAAGIVIIAQDITELQKNEQELRRVNRALKTLIGCNQGVNSAQTEDELLDNICEAFVSRGGYKLAWIGFAEDNPEKTVRPRAQAGYDDGYLENLRVSWADDEWGGGPTGMAIKSGAAQVARHILTDSRYQPWREQANQRGYQSSIALPLTDKSLGIIGALNIYAPEPDAFDSQEIDLLGEIAEDVVNGLNTLRIRREHLKASEDLARNEDLLRGVFEQAAVGIALVTITGKWLMFNQKLCSLTGYSREELMELSFQGITHPDDLATSLNYVEQMLSDNIKNYSLEKRYIRKDGQSLWVNLTVSLVRNEQDQPKFFISVIEDISGRKQAEAEQEKLVAIIEHSPDFIGISDLNGRLLYLNNAGRTLVGMSRSDQLDSANIMDYLAVDSREYFQNEIFQAARQTGAGHGELFVEQAGSGNIVPVELNLFTISGNLDERATGMALIARDLTERNEGESRLRQAQKMEAMGTLAGGIAHDFNNILSAILGYAQLAEMRNGASSAVHEDLQEVIKASRRATELVKQILTFSRKVDHELTPLQPHLIIKESLKLLRASLPTTITIKENIIDCGLILADPTQIHQIMMNLCTNAYHAMANEKGLLQVSLAQVILGEKEITGELNVAAGPFVELTVSDSGCGMDEETVGRIFEPYFTTKEVGRGTGLGLALVHSIVKGCGGLIKVATEVGRGTTFQVFFPCYEQGLIEEHQEETERILTGDEKILVVDDEGSIVELHKLSLERLGYHVVGTTSSMEALALFKADPQSFAILISDQTMPQMTGLELGKHILSIRPELPIIICTGYSSILSNKEAEEVGVAAILMKPVERKQLALQIRTLLDNR